METRLIGNLWSWSMEWSHILIESNQENVCLRFLADALILRNFLEITSLRSHYLYVHQQIPFFTKMEKFIESTLQNIKSFPAVSIKTGNWNIYLMFRRQMNSNNCTNVQNVTFRSKISKAWSESHASKSKTFKYHCFTHFKLFNVLN